MADSRSVVPAERIERSTLLIRSQKVMLDDDLAALYEVETKALNRAVRRNLDRFPEDFMFHLTDEEFANLRYQSGTSSSAWGGRRYPPYAFTEQGVAMLSSVLRSERAVRVNIEIMRAFVRLRPERAIVQEALARIPWRAVSLQGAQRQPAQHRGAGEGAGRLAGGGALMRPRVRLRSPIVAGPAQTRDPDGPTGASLKELGYGG